MGTFLKGLNYRSSVAYDIMDFLKLRGHYDLRFRIAAEYLSPGQSVLDVCAGNGRLRRFLPHGCKYYCIEKSPQFRAALARQGVEYFDLDLHKGLKGFDSKFDVLVMLISLCQFRSTSAYSLLEDFKNIAKKVIIVEEALMKKRSAGSLRQRLMDYLGAVEYYVPCELFTFPEFENMMRDHNYIFKRHDKRYAIGYYE